MAGRVLALVHREGLLLWVQEVAHVLVDGLDAVGGELGSGVGGEGVVVVSSPLFWVGPLFCFAFLGGWFWRVVWSGGVRTG